MAFCTCLKFLKKESEGSWFFFFKLNESICHLIDCLFLSFVRVMLALGPWPQVQLTLPLWGPVLSLPTDPFQSTEDRTLIRYQLYHTNVVVPQWTVCVFFYMFRGGISLLLWSDYFPFKPTHLRLFLLCGGTLWWAPCWTPQLSHWGKWISHGVSHCKPHSE